MDSFKLMRYLFSLCFMLFNSNSNCDALERQERTLVFPPTAPTRTQWIVGIGIPLEDLLYEAMTTGYVLKAEYFLPETAEQLRTKNTLDISGRSVPDNEMPKFQRFLVKENELGGNQTKSNYNHRLWPSYRWSVYKGLEGLADRMGQPGRSCVLKSICEAAELPFHYQNGLLAELMHILLTPSSSADKLSEHADNDYLQAEYLGRTGGDCNRLFANCHKSLLEIFSDVHDD